MRFAKAVALVLAAPALTSLGGVTTATFAAWLETQQPVELRENLCDRCSITIAQVASFKGVDSLGGVTNGFLTRDSRGRYYHSNYQASWAIQVFDSTGRVLTTIGRKGAGPGEFGFVNRILAGVGDTLHVFDQRTRRYTVLSPTYEIVRTAMIGARVSYAAELKPGTLVLATHVPARRDFGYPLHFWSGNALGPGFGGTDALRDGPVPSDRSLTRRIAVSADGSFWTARFTAYVLEHWSPNGKLLQRFDRKVSWFGPSTDVMPGDAEPRPFIAGISETPDGLLRVLVAQPNPNWRQATGAGPVVNGRALTRVTSDDPSARRWTRIELIDPKKGEVITSTLVRRALDGFATPETVYGFVPDQDGVLTVRVWKLVHLK